MAKQDDVAYRRKGDERRDVSINVRVCKEEAGKLDRLAEFHDSDRSDVIRKGINNEYEKLHGAGLIE